MTEQANRPVADNFARRFAPPELYDPKKRREWKLGRNDNDRGPYVIELNLQHIEGLSGATAALQVRLKLVGEALNTDPPAPEQISKTYARCLLTVAEWQKLLVLDGEEAERDAAKRSGQSPDENVPTPASPTPDKEKPVVNRIDSMRCRAIYKLWPDFPIQSQIYKSVATVKSDAAFRSFDASGDGIVWAVIDSGIDANHPHFDLSTGHTLRSAEVRDLHRCFVSSASVIPGTDIEYIAEAPRDPDSVEPPGRDASPVAYQKYLDDRQALISDHARLALNDEFGHGTHVAGIIAGGASNTCSAIILERAERAENGELKRGEFQQTGEFPGDRIRGMAPKCRLISLRVLDSNGEGRSSDVIRALDYIRDKLNDNPKLLRVHGVNLSVGYEFDAEMFACGQSPICAEVNRLVQSGVVVVAAAGNTGFGTVASAVRPTKVGLSNTINDPGNAEFAITVGATHRDSPYTYGVSYFSSKGPTGDGRLKPDLVAPGERITSCGAGKRLDKAKLSARVQQNPPAAYGNNPVAIPPGQPAKVEPPKAYYMEDSGTSMAAPHVSGAIAAFLSIRREFIGKPLDVKRIFLTTASPLGRERYFEGHGLIDLIRAIQSV
jgi:serine protease AprX